FLVCGLWHGARWTFVAWGLFHGTLLALERLGLQRALAACPRPVQHVYALLGILVGWVIFRATSPGHAAAVLAAMAGFGGGAGREYAPGVYLDEVVVLGLIVGVVGSTPLLPWLRARRTAVASPAWGATVESAGVVAVVVALLGALAFMAAQTHHAFIYFRF